MPRNYNDAALVFVPMGTLKYVFRSRLKDTLRNNLGQVLIEAALTDITGVIVGANAPKPPKATKKIPEFGTVSSFCDGTKGAELKRDGWKVRGSKYPQYSINLLEQAKDSVTYVLTLNGVKYAFNSTPISESVIFPGLGGILSEATAANENDQLVWGAEFPKPPKMKLTNSAGKSFSTFIDPSKVDDAKTLGAYVKGGLTTTKAFNAKYLGIFDETPAA